jgi:DNA-binding MarR family transcriptional regulator/GNAT superfamily N-acetyltransferase
MANTSQLAQRIEDLRHFNRFYTRQIGVLEEGLLHSSFSLTEARILYELAHRNNPTATELREELRLDAGYLSRILRKFKKQALIDGKSSNTDARQILLTLTEKGEKAFAKLNQRSIEQLKDFLENLSEAEQIQLIQATKSIEHLLSPSAHAEIPYILRPLQPGDLGWIIHQHGVLYAREYGWDERFEASVAKIAADFITNHDPRFERCWIAERDSQIAGCVFLVKYSTATSQLRLFLVEPNARGLEIGSRLVNACLRFARQAGYRKMVLWTNNVLPAARHIFERAGFKPAREQLQSDFGPKVVGQTWSLKLGARVPSDK